MRLTSEAEQDLRSLGKADRERVKDRLRLLASPATAPRVKKIGKTEPAYRIRWGNWRALFERRDRDRVVLVHRVKRRNESTY